MSWVLPPRYVGKLVANESIPLPYKYTYSISLQRPVFSSLKAIDVNAVQAGSDIASIVQGPSNEIMAGIGAAVLLLGATFVSGGDAGADNTKKEIIISEPEVKIDVSIPYDAAIVLAYNDWLASGDRKSEYEKFKVAYIKKAVAEVVAKKAGQELERLA